jgi:hypothetical protein
MRLRRIKRTLEQNIVHLNYKREYLSGNHPGYLYTDLNNLKCALEKVKGLGLYTSLISEIETTVIFSTLQDEIILTDSKEDTRLKKGLEVLRSGCQALLMVLRELYHEEDDESMIYIQMPKIKDLEDLSKKSKLLHTAISQSILDPSIKGTIKVKSYDIGSLWIAVSVGSLAAVKLIAGIVWAAAVIQKKRKKFKTFEQHVRSLEIRSESMEDLKEAQKKQLDLSLEAEANNLAAQFYKGNDAEKMERLKYSIKLICGLMHKGVEIHPALNAPKDIEKLFPDFGNLGLIESRIQELGTAT